MPTYQYACTECGEHLEAVQSFSDAALTECPACQGKLRKVFNSVGIVFKGSGFYRNDSRKTGASAESPGSGSSSNESSAASAPSSSSPAAPSSTSSSSSSSSSSESSAKPAAKKESKAATAG